MKTREVVLAGSVGIGAALLRVLYTFFPYLSVMDVLVFGLAGFGVSRSHPSRRWVSYLLVVLPALGCIGFVLVVLGPSKLSAGVGTGHLRGALLVPLAAGLGFLAEGRSSHRPVAV